MKKVIVIAVSALVICLLLFLFLEYRKAKENSTETFLLPRLEYSAFIVNEITPTKTQMDLQLLIDNPSILGFKSDSLL